MGSDGAVGSLLFTVSVAAFTPAELGLKATFNDSVAPGAMRSGSFGADDNVKSEGSVPPKTSPPLLIFSAASPVLVRTIVCAAVVLFFGPLKYKRVASDNMCAAKN